MILNTAEAQWRVLLSKVITDGLMTAPRDQLTREVLSLSANFDMKYPVILSQARKLNYKFMAAEALWILNGSNRVDDIVPWNKNLLEFSDDGKTFAGAYGPPLSAQLEYLVESLACDRSTRQAVATIWRQNPPKSKDIPCTVAMVYHLRDNQLHAHVYMRSSDLWLGWPYDMFNFTMLAARLLALYRAKTGERPVLGNLYWTAASAHLYERNREQARAVLAEPWYNKADTAYPPFPEALLQDYELLHGRLLLARDRGNLKDGW